MKKMIMIMITLTYVTQASAGLSDSWNPFRQKYIDPISDQERSDLVCFITINKGEPQEMVLTSKGQIIRFGPESLLELQQTGSIPSMMLVTSNDNILSFDGNHLFYAGMIGDDRSKFLELAVDCKLESVVEQERNTSCKRGHLDQCVTFKSLDN